jgi:hypothetical protein
MKKLHLVLVLVMLVLLPWVLPVRANLYSGEVLVEGQGGAERGKVLPFTLIHVLQKLSGLRDIPPGPALERALRDAPAMVVSTSYRNVQRSLPDGTVLNDQRLVANFLPQEINQVVLDMALPRWRIERKPVMIWVVVDDGFQRRLMPLEFQYAWDAVDEVAANRGLPVSWPSLTPDELAAVDLQLLWGGFTEQLTDGNGGDLMIAAARREGLEWSVRWTLSSGERIWNWRSSDADLSWALVQGVHEAVNTIAGNNTIAASATSDFSHVLEVGGLRNAADYARCLNYLNGLSVVNAVDVEAATPGRVRFRVKMNAAPEYLMSALDSDGVLERGMSATEYVLLP